ncbi:MFS transporter [Pectobacterium actinidiae]|uniref:MFS transporter n=1 Tax=Pectobacterium actinidiae TaxID=1507808 RepID=UPI0037F5F2BD
MNTIASLPIASLKLRHLLPAVAGVYITQTLVTALITQALPTLLRSEGASLQLIGLTALLWVPWGIRFLWSPLVERWRLPAGGLERRSRILILLGQWLMGAILLLLGLASLAGHLSLSEHAGWILAGLLLAALVAATADVACDGFVLDQLAMSRRGWGNVAQVGGSYVGAMLGAGGFLLVAGALGWPQALMAASLAIVLLSVPMLLLREPPRRRAPALDHRPGLMHALRRPEMRTGLLLLLVSSVGVRLTLGMFGPFLLDKGLSLEQLGWLFGSLHIGAGLTGAFLGGVLVRAAPGWRAVWIAVGLKACVLVALALAAPSAPLPVLMGLVGLMLAALGFVWVALYSALMGLASPLQAGVDFTLFQSADALLAVAGGVAGGWVAQHLGYDVCFGLAAASAIAAVLLIRRKASSLDSATARRGDAHDE